MAFQFQATRNLPGALTEIIEVIERLRLRTLAPHEAANVLERLLEGIESLPAGDRTDADAAAMKAVGDLVGLLRTADSLALDAVGLCRTARDRRLPRA